MSAYVPLPDEATPESNEVLLESVRRNALRIRASLQRGKHLDQIAHELVVLVDLALQVIKDGDEAASGEYDGFGEFAAACLRSEGGLDSLDLLDEVAKRARHLRSLHGPALKSNEPPNPAKSPGGSSTFGG